LGFTIQSPSAAPPRSLFYGVSYRDANCFLFLRHLFEILVVTASDKKTAVIAGAGPAGLTAALELLRRSNVTPIVIEAESQVGGISKTINYRGNRMDLGGHRFFSKSDWVMRWWQEILPVAAGQAAADDSVRISYQRQYATFKPEAFGQQNTDAVMLVRRRLSRIFYRRRFYDYPLTLNGATLRNLGLAEALRIGLSYGRAQLIRKTPETTLKDFLVNRFGDRLYRTFFKGYTEKVWGVPCEDISSEWGAQRIKGLSVAKAVAHAVAAPFRNSRDLHQKSTETSLIEQFLYPKFGPGQMWEAVARRVCERGGQVRLQQRIVGIHREDRRITSVELRDAATGSTQRLSCDYLISTMPVRDLVTSLQPEDSQIQRVADGLPYRDFVTAGLLLKRMNSTNHQKSDNGNGMPPDNWIYVQEPNVRMGRIQIFNNWSPAMVADPCNIWLGLEYFCREGDDLWSMDKGHFTDLAANELEGMGLIDRRDVIDGTLVRVPKAYPAYFGHYAEFDKIRTYLDTFPNLFPVGRNGMHRYNNQDHSMLAANAAVTAIVSGGAKSNIWNINIDNAYHEASETHTSNPGSH
jgi:protoporphyrinogen oxidase